MDADGLVNADDLVDANELVDADDLTDDITDEKNISKSQILQGNTGGDLTGADNLLDADDKVDTVNLKDTDDGDALYDDIVEDVLLSKLKRNHNETTHILGTDEKKTQNFFSTSHEIPADSDTDIMCEPFFRMGSNTDVTIALQCAIKRFVSVHPAGCFSAFFVFFFFFYCCVCRCRRRGMIYKRRSDKNRGEYTAVSMYDDILDDENFNDDFTSSYVDSDEDSAGTIMSNWSEKDDEVEINKIKDDEDFLTLEEING